MTATLRLYLIRHGETEWSLSGQHTGRSDIALTEHGEDEARALESRLRGISFSHVLTWPSGITASTKAAGPRTFVRPAPAGWFSGTVVLAAKRPHRSPGGRIGSSHGFPGCTATSRCFRMDNSAACSPRGGLDCRLSKHGISRSIRRRSAYCPMTPIIQRSRLSRCGTPAQGHRWAAGKPAHERIDRQSDVVDLDFLLLELLTDR